jgi:AraC-like DNA-binding protein
MASTRFALNKCLKDYIEEITIVDQKPVNTLAVEQTFTVVPDYYQYLCFVLRDNFRVIDEDGLRERSNALIIGSHLRTTDVKITDDHQVIYVKLKPAALHRLIRIPQTHLVNNCIDARHFFCGKINELIDKLMSAKNINEQNVLVQDFLIGTLIEVSINDNFTRAIDHLITSKGNLTIDSAAKISCLSLRQFERVCKERVGLSPKMLGRLIRFSTVYQLRQDSPKLLWNDIAFQCGYFDHMHMVRDFKYFAKTSPTMGKEGFAVFPFTWLTS